MRTEVIKADSIDEAAERILDELKEDPADTTRSIGSRNNVIYFDGWDGLGASAVFRAVAQRLTAMASSDEGPAALQFDQIIHVDCSKWESRRSLQRAVAEQLELPAPVMDMFDRQDDEDDFQGIAEGSRTEIPQVLRAMFQRIQERNRRFLVIFHNGSTEEMDLAIFGFLLSGYSTNKVMWTFQGKLRLKPRMKVVKVIETKGKTDVFLSASTRHEDEDPRKLLSFLVHQEATEVAASLVDNNTGGGRGIVDQPSKVMECFLYMLKLCCLGYHFNMVGGYDYDMATHSCNYWMCDAIIRQERQGEATDGGDASWQAADALRLAMPFNVDYYLHDHPYLPPSHLVMWCNDDNNSTTSQPGTPFPSPPNSYGHLLVPACAIPNADMFQYFDNKLSVLKLCGRTFSLSSPPFINCHNLKFLWLDHCQVQDTDTDTAGGEEEEAMIRRCFQKLWVLDVRYTRCDGILSARLLDFMTQLRELNVMGAQHWDIGQLQGRLTNIRKLRVTKSTVGCTSCSESNLLGMNKMELLDFSGNRTKQEGGVAANLSGISTSSNQLETVIIIDGCVGIQKFSFRGCAKLKNLLLSGLFEDLCTLDLSGTVVKTLDLSAMTAQRLDEVILDNCDKLCAILWPPEDKRKRSLQKLHIDTTQSATTSRSREEKMKAGSTAATGSSSSWPMVLVNGAQPPSEFNWYISIKDARLLKSIVPSFEKYFKDNRVHLEISSPSCCPNIEFGGTENEGIQNGTGEEPRVLSNRRQQQPKYNNNSASMYYADVATMVAEDHQLQGGEGNGNDAPTITRTRPCPHPLWRLAPSNCYLYTLDQRVKMDGGAIATIPSIICDRAFILHVHDSLYNTSIPGSAQWDRLRWCRVERCPRLDFIFTAPQLGGGSSVRMCWELRTFWASQLPRTRFMWDMSKLPLSQIQRRSFEEVTLLHLDFCPRLIHVLPFSSLVFDTRLLEIIEIVWCGDLRVVFPLLDTNNTENHQEQQQKPPGAMITMVDFPYLKHIHLHELPMLESICGLGRMNAPQLQTIKIRGCWSLRHLPAVRSNRSNNKVECDCEKEWWDRLEWDGLDGKHHPSLYRPVHSRYYKKRLLRGSVLI